MMFVMLVVGIGLVLAGLLAIGFGIPIKEFSTGNTLIVTGVIGVCAGAIMFALWVSVRELKGLARRLGAVLPEARGEAAIRPVLPPDAMLDTEPGAGGFPFDRDQPAVRQDGRVAPSIPPPPWQDEAVLRDHPMPESELVDTLPPAPKPKRNLLFSSTSRKERERALTRTGEPLPLAIEPAEPGHAPFDDPWPRPDRAKPGELPPLRRPPRSPLAFEKADEGPARDDDQPAVTVLKSGTVDGMAYSLYSDGSIEAQMPEGMMRFASIDELRVHLEKQP